MIDLLTFLFDGVFIAIMVMMSFLEAIWNIALFRWRISWLPIWSNPGIYFDTIIPDQRAFHYFKGGQSILALWLIWLFNRQDFVVHSIQKFHNYTPLGIVDFLLILGMIPLIWVVYYGLGLFTWQYHIIWIKPQYWKQEIWKVFPLVIYTKWIKR